MNADQLREANGQDAAVEFWRARALKAEAIIERLEEHCREVIELIIPNESIYKCDYRRDWALRVLEEVTGGERE